LAWLKVPEASGSGFGTPGAPTGGAVAATDRWPSAVARSRVRTKWLNGERSFP
jgi:hypothetical protein